MKMDHVHITYYPAVSGLSIVTQKLAEGMAKLRHGVRVTTSTHGTGSRLQYEHIHRVRSLKPPYENPTYPLEYPIDVIKHAGIIPRS